jgi:acyl carrier protein
MTIAIEQKLLELVDKEFNRKKLKDFTLDSTFTKELGLDSLSLTELVVACDDEFGIEIDMDLEELAVATTLRPLYNTIVRLVSQR